jgi:hypothetical protein
VPSKRARWFLALALGGALGAGVIITVILMNPMPPYVFTPHRDRESSNADVAPRANPTQETHR